jgi:peptidoglycan/LPS O-acetylase OafA/YrhL
VKPVQFTLLSHMRWFAALLVAVSHIRNLVVGDFAGGGIPERLFYFITGYGHAGVIVFFVLSGFLVGRKVRELAAAPDPDWRGYLNDRFSRIFIVFIPAVALSLAVLALATRLAPDAPFVAAAGWSSSLQPPLVDDWSLRTWVGLLTLMNVTLTWTPTVNAPLWSLAYEWTYYVAALAAVLAWRKIRSLGAVMIMVYAAGLLLVAAIKHPPLLVGGVIWSAGLAASYISDKGWLRGKATLGGAIILAVGALVLWRIMPIPRLVIGLAVALLISHQAWRSWDFGRGWGDHLASFSYSLYVTHFPITILVLVGLHLSGIDHRLPFGPVGVGLMLLATVFAFVAARGFAWLTEDRTWKFKRAISALFGRSPVIQAVSP